MFQNRLEKLYRHRKKLAARQGISCYRLYDHDLPEFPLLVELYEDRVYVAEYKRRHGLDEAAHEQWLDSCIDIIAGTTGVQREMIFTRMRQRKAGRQGQYQRVAAEDNAFIVKENGLQFIVNLSDYLDTGLFLDHRITRQMVREKARGKAVLNLFCYTGSFSVYAIAGGAASVVSADLSKTYLAWAERNRRLNFPHYTAHETVHADVKAQLPRWKEASFDLIVMDPPTFSNSKRMEDFLDIQQDHAALLNEALRLLRPGGEIYFSTNYTRFRLDHEKIKAGAIRDITRATTPFDFEGKLKRACFLLTK